LSACGIFWAVKISTSGDVGEPYPGYDEHWKNPANTGTKSHQKEDEVGFIAQ
jgi:hypothetical protein